MSFAAPRASRRRTQGFTLLEVLVAFALLATAAVLLLGLLSNGLRDVGLAERRGEATLHARSLLDNAGRMERLRPGSRSGAVDNGRYRWTLSVTRVADPIPAPLIEDNQDPNRVPNDGVMDTSEPVIYRLDLQLTWGAASSAETVELTTLRALYPLPEDQ
jgi:general secretion pathway protein I